MAAIPIGDRMSDDRAVFDRAPYLTTHRALAACTRELARLTDGVRDGVDALYASLGTEKPVVRQSPGKFIVQLGPVALTIVWLRSTLDSVATGELLVNVWEGAVAPKLQHQSERPPKHAATESAHVVWEDVLVAEAPTEAEWVWQPQSADSSTYSSTALAEMCVGRLRTAFAAAL